MNKSKPTLEKLFEDPTFIDFCLNSDVKDSNPWNSYISKNPQDEAVVKEAKEVVLLLTGKMPDALIEAKLVKFKELFYETKFSKSSQNTFKTSRHYSLRVALKVAATLLLISGFAFFFLKTNGKQSFTFATIAGQTITTPFTSRNVLILSDGTKVILYPGSKLIISDDFNAQDRKIAVTGQIYLKISSNKEKPFVVYSRHTTTTAIGTAFYVRDFNQGKQSSVVLVNGKVKVTEPKHGAVSFLEPGTAVEIDNQTLKSEKISLDRATLEALANSKLEFNDAGMKSIVSKLELFYGIQIDLSTCNCEFKRITGDYSQKSLTTILNSISFTNGLSWEFQDDKIVFKPRSK